MPDLETTVFYLAASIVVVWSLWCLLALYYFPTINRGLGAAAAVGLAVVNTGLYWQLGGSLVGLLPAVVLNAGVTICWLMISPQTHRRRLANLPDLPEVEWKDDCATVHRFRQTTGATDDGWQIEQTTREINLNDVKSVWLGVQQFNGIFVLGHTFLSFGMNDGSFVSVSIQSWRPEGMGFSVIAGAFKQYGLIYYFGDERAVMTREAATSDDRLFLYPIKAPRQQIQAMLRQLLQRGQQLNDNPEFYNTITNNCTNALVYNLNAVTQSNIHAFGPRVVLSGLTGQMAYDHNMLGNEPFDEIAEKAQINERACEALNDEDFSQRIRQPFQSSTNETP